YLDLVETFRGQQFLELPHDVTGCIDQDDPGDPLARVRTALADTSISFRFVGLYLQFQREPIVDEQIRPALISVWPQSNFDIGVVIVQFPRNGSPKIASEGFGIFVLSFIPARLPALQKITYEVANPFNPLGIILFCAASFRAVIVIFEK